MVLISKNSIKLLNDWKKEFNKLTSSETKRLQQAIDNYNNLLEQNTSVFDREKELAIYEYSARRLIKQCNDDLRHINPISKRIFGGINAKSNEITISGIPPQMFGVSTFVDKELKKGWNHISWCGKYFTIPEGIYFGIYGFEDPTRTTKIFGYRLKIGNELLTIDNGIFDAFQPESNYRYLLPEPILILPKAIFEIQVQVPQQDKIVLKPLGVIVGITSYVNNLKNQDYPIIDYPSAQPDQFNQKTSKQLGELILGELISNSVKEVNGTNSYPNTGKNTKITYPVIKKERPMCGACGSANDNNANFCETCGVKLIR